MLSFTIQSVIGTSPPAAQVQRTQDRPPPMVAKWLKVSHAETVADEANIARLTFRLGLAQNKSAPTTATTIEAICAVEIIAYFDARPSQICSVRGVVPSLSPKVRESLPAQHRKGRNAAAKTGLSDMKGRDAAN